MAHVAGRVAFIAAGRFFASEDDAYRAYTAFLLGRGGRVVGRLWLPGQLLR